MYMYIYFHSVTFLRMFTHDDSILHVYVLINVRCIATKLSCIYLLILNPYSMFIYIYISINKEVIFV